MQQMAFQRSLQQVLEEQQQLPFLGYQQQQSTTEQQQGLTLQPLSPRSKSV